MKITWFFLEMNNSQVGFVAEGAESGTPFPDIDLSTKVSVTPFILHHHILLLLLKLHDTFCTCSYRTFKEWL